MYRVYIFRQFADTEERTVYRFKRKSEALFFYRQITLYSGKASIENVSLNF